MNDTLPPGPVSQSLSNAVYSVMTRRGIHSVLELDLPDVVRYQVLGLDPFTVEGLAAVADALGTTSSEIVAQAGVDSDDADAPLLTDEPGKITKLTGPDSVQEALQARQRRVSTWYDTGYADGLASHTELIHNPPGEHPDYVRGWRDARAQMRGTSRGDQ